ncbi:MAG: hypothetical protein ABIS01_10520 [Ferruginibacter sp.]
MIPINNHFLYHPGGENESGSAPLDSESSQKENAGETPENIDEEIKDPKTIVEKIREALQDWSNKDEQDTEFDDTRV